MGLGACADRSMRPDPNKRVEGRQQVRQLPGVEKRLALSYDILGVEQVIKLIREGKVGKAAISDAASFRLHVHAAGTGSERLAASARLSGVSTPKWSNEPSLDCPSRAA